MANLLTDKEILRWESQFFERKNKYFWTGLVEYRPLIIAQREPIRKTEKSSRDESYNELFTENDRPLFNVLREWRAERSKEGGIPLYIICNNTQLAKKVTILSPWRR
jgi:superfamily II DNA helicase RecQ